MPWREWQEIAGQQRTQLELGGGFKHCFICHPDIWGNDPIWRAYFLDGLVHPPTSDKWDFRKTSIATGILFFPKKFHGLIEIISKKNSCCLFCGGIILLVSIYCKDQICLFWYFRLNQCVVEWDTFQSILLILLIPWRFSTNWCFPTSTFMAFFFRDHHWTIHFGEIKQCKCIVNLKDSPFY